MERPLIAVAGLLLLLVAADESISQKCRRLLGCAVKKNCVKLAFLIERFRNSTISRQMYDDLDAGIDYGCIFTSGCLDECNRCPLCITSREQLVDVLSGSKRSATGECSVLVNCATDCVQQSNSNFTMISYCMRHLCAYHCFDGTCPKCSAFVTRLFNQICVSADLRNKANFKSGCLAAENRDAQLFIQTLARGTARCPKPPGGSNHLTRQAAALGLACPHRNELFPQLIINSSFRASVTICFTKLFTRNSRSSSSEPAKDQ